MGKILDHLDELTEFRSHKIVRAARIRQAWLADGVPTVVVDGPKGGPLALVLPADTFARGTPQRGDYVVVYDDNPGKEPHVSWSPAAPFEAGYDPSILAKSP